MARASSAGTARQTLVAYFPLSVLNIKAGRDHYAHRLVSGAEKAVAHPESELYLLSRQNGRFVKNGLDRLELPLVLLLTTFEDEALSPLVSLAEGHGNAGAGSCGLDEVFGDKIGVRAVYRIDRGGNGNLCDRSLVQSKFT